MKIKKKLILFGLIIIVVVIVIVVIPIGQSKRKKLLVLTSYKYNNYAPFLEICIQNTDATLEHSLWKIYNTKYVFNINGYPSYLDSYPNTDVINSYPLYSDSYQNTDVQNEFKKIENNKSLLRVISFAIKNDFSFLITTDVNNIGRNKYEVIYFLMDLQKGCHIYEIVTKLVIDMNTIEEYDRDSSNKIVKEIIKLLDEID